MPEQMPEQVVYKYVLQQDEHGNFSTKIPDGAYILDWGLTPVPNRYESAIALWAQVDPDVTPTRTISYVLLATGQRLPVKEKKIYIYVATLRPSESLVFHLFEEVEDWESVERGRLSPGVG